MKLHALQHVPFEGPAGIEVWAHQNQHPINKTFLFENYLFPDLNQFDLLVVLGGPMNIYEEKEFPWLTAEKKFIETAIEKGKYILGICLGAQLVADVLGGRVTKNHEKEIGWHDVEITNECARSKLFKNFPSRFLAFHWHGDTFQIPKNAIHLAQSKACANQAFEYGGRVLGLQFHLESTTESIEKLIQNCGNEIANKPFIQSESEIRAGFRKLVKINSFMNQILDQFARLVK